MKLLPGCGELTGHIVCLNTTRYGLKQALHEFHKLLTSKLIDFGFEQCLADTCVFRMLDPKDTTKVKIILLCHVDDLMVAGSDPDKADLEAYKHVLQDESSWRARTVQWMFV